ncbi:MAG TPA: DUF6175 family protein [Balneolaceae bacterium]|nr:DUF6175 family protein [Balneolaceae bacterium]
MVVPSDVWCNQHGYLMEFDNQGVTERVPDYQRALQENPNLLMVISKLNELMADRGFPLKDLESSLRSLKMQSAEDNMLTNDSGGQLAESPIDALKRVAQADIWMQVTWTLNQQGPKRSISYVLRGLDAYTNKQIAGASGTGKPSFSVELPVLLEEAVVAHLDKFNKQLQNYFDDMFAKGREVALRVRVWNNWDHDLEDYFGDEDLSEIIEDWMYDNTKQGRFSTTIATENQMFFEQVRIPLFDDRDRAIDTRRWARDLQKFLRKKYAIEAKLMMKGLGQAQLVLGER